MDKNTEQRGVDCVAAYERHYQVSSSDPSQAERLDVWNAAWNACYAAAIPVGYQRSDTLQPHCDGWSNWQQTDKAEFVRLKDLLEENPEFFSKRIRLRALYAGPVIATPQQATDEQCADVNALIAYLDELVDDGGQGGEKWEPAQAAIAGIRVWQARTYGVRGMNHAGQDEGSGAFADARHDLQEPVAEVIKNAAGQVAIAFVGGKQLLDYVGAKFYIGAGPGADDCTNGDSELQGRAGDAEVC